MLSSKMVSGLLLLAKLYPKGKAETTDYGVQFTIWDKDYIEISNEDIQILEDLGWRLTKYDNVHVWDW